MKRIILMATMILAASMFHAGARNLSFDKNGEFRIIQLTDCHMKYEMPEEYGKTLDRIEKILNAEHPDFIALTGDIVTGNRGTRSLMWRIVLDRLDAIGVPYAIVYGNHDAEGMDELPRPDMSRIVVSGKLNMNTLDAAGELADIRIPVRGRGGEPVFDIYMLDSHDYAHNFGYTDDYGKYAWFTHDQVDWLRNQCLESTKANGGVNVPSFAFFHIPLCEFETAVRNGGFIGVKGEGVCCAPINTGMFGAMYETGNIMGVFVGHDHDDNYIVSHCGIALGYGGFSGDDTTYNHLAHGFRVIVVKEGERAFTTWIHEEDGRIQFKAAFKDGKLEKIK